MRVLLDTCVLTELLSPRGDAGVRKFVDGLRQGDVFVSVVSLGEIKRGIFLLPRGKRKATLTAWLETLKQQYETSLLSVGAETALLWGEITARAKQQGFQLPAIDALLAATAMEHGLHVLTRNVKDFVPSGAMILNPWVD